MAQTHPIDDAELGRGRDPALGGRGTDLCGTGQLAFFSFSWLDWSFSERDWSFTRGGETGRRVYPALPAMTTVCDGVRPGGSKGRLATMYSSSQNADVSEWYTCTTGLL